MVTNPDNKNFWLGESLGIWRAFGLSVSIFALTTGISASAATEQVARYGADYFAQYQVNTAMDMLGHVPGFTVDNGSMLRGYGGALGNVLINGTRPSSKTDALWEILSRIPATSVARIDIVSGAADGIDMQGQPTVANVILKGTNTRSESLASTFYFEPDGEIFPSAAGTFGMARGDQSLSLYFSAGSTPDLATGKGTRRTTYAGSTAPQDMTFATTGVSKTDTFKLNYGQQLLGGKLQWNSTLNPTRYRFAGDYQSSSQVSVANVNKLDNIEHGLDYARALMSSLDLDLKGIYRLTDTHFTSNYGTDSSTSVYALASKAKETIAVGQLAWKPNRTLIIRAGYETAVNATDSSVQYSIDRQAISIPSAIVSVREDRSEAQLSSAWQAQPSLSLEAGLKVENSTLRQHSDTEAQKDFVYSKPRFLFSWFPASALEIRARVEREVSQLNFTDFVSSIALLDQVVTAGNPDLVPSKTWKSEGGIEYQGDKGAMMVTYSHSQITDVIDRVPIITKSATYDAAGNIGEGTGDSLIWLGNIPTDTWGITGGIVKLTGTWKRSHVVDPTTLESRRLSGEQPRAWRIEFSQDLPRYQTSWGLAADNGWTNTNWQVAESDYNHGTGWIKGYIEYRPQPRLTVLLELDNLGKRVITYDRQHYVGSRNDGSTDFFEQNVTRNQPFAMLAVRKDW